MYLEVRVRGSPHLLSWHCCKWSLNQGVVLLLTRACLLNSANLSSTILITLRIWLTNRKLHCSSTGTTVSFQLVLHQLLLRFCHAESYWDRCGERTPLQVGTQKCNILSLLLTSYCSCCVLLSLCAYAAGSNIQFVGVAIVSSKVVSNIDIYVLIVFESSQNGPMVVSRSFWRCEPVFIEIWYRE